jgi:hypothetical protein
MRKMRSFEEPHAPPAARRASFALMFVKQGSFKITAGKSWGFVVCSSNMSILGTKDRASRYGGDHLLFRRFCSRDWWRSKKWKKRWPSSERY